MCIENLIIKTQGFFSLDSAISHHKANRNRRGWVWQHTKRTAPSWAASQWGSTQSSGPSIHTSLMRLAKQWHNHFTAASLMLILFMQSVYLLINNMCYPNSILPFLIQNAVKTWLHIVIDLMKWWWVFVLWLIHRSVVRYKAHEIVLYRNTVFR